VNFFDTANMYSNGESERVLGEALEGHREESVVATKAYFQMAESNPNSGGLSRKAIEQELEHSLDRLGMETIDLYQLHRWDDDTPIEETLAALDDAVRRGKVRHVGASSMWAHQFAEALHTSDREGYERFATMQNHYNLAYREEERETLPLCVRRRDRRDAVESAGARVPHAPAPKRRTPLPDANARRRTDETEDGPDRVRGCSTNTPRRDRVEHLGRRAGGQRASPSVRRDFASGPSTSGPVRWIQTIESRRASPTSSSPTTNATVVGGTGRATEHLEDAVEALDIDLSKSDMEWLEEPSRSASPVTSEVLRPSKRSSRERARRRTVVGGTTTGDRPWQTTNNADDGDRATAPPEPRAATPKATTARRNPSASASRRSASDASRSARKATGPTPKR